jgi:uncharacterized RDD family membrane protein YckC
MDDILDEKNYESRQLSYATFGMRSAAFITDLLLCGMFFYGYFLLFSSTNNLVDFLQLNWWKLLLCGTLYVIYFEGSEQQATIGKQITGIRLLSDQKTDIDFTMSVKHFIVSVFLCFGYFRMLSSPEKQTLADKICKIYVIQK